MATHIVNRFDFDNVISGFFHVIEYPDLYLKYKPMMESDLFFQNDVAAKPRSLRNMIKWFHEMMKAEKTKAPSLPSFRDYMSSYIIDTEQKTEALAVFDSYVPRPDIRKRMDDKGCFDIFLEYLKIIKFVKYSSDIFGSYQKGDVAKAADLMKTTLTEVAQINNDEHETFNALVDIPRIILEKDNEQKKVLLLGCHTLDQGLGGFEEKTLNLFISRTNGGKSMMAHHLIKQAIIQRMYVHIACVEDRKVSFTRKLVACMTGIPMNRFKEFKEKGKPSSEEEKAILDAMKLIDQYVKADFLYGSSIEGIHKVKKEYDVWCRHNKHPVPNVDIVDYTGHISGKSKGDKMYEQMRNAYGERKDFALANDKIAFDFAQVNREGSKRVDSEECLTINDLAGSFDLAQVCDNIISINRNAMNIETSTAVLKIAKARDGEVNQEFQVGTNFGAAQFIMSDENTRWLSGRAADVARLRPV